MFPAEASNFCTETTGFLGLFPGLWPHLLRLSGWFHLPSFRDYTMCSGEEGAGQPQHPPVLAGDSYFNLLPWGVGGGALWVPALPAWCPPTPFLKDPGIRPPASALTPGLLSSDKASAAYLLSRPEVGQVAVLAAGGPLEALDPKASALTLRIRNQKGFVKLALRKRPVAGPDTRGLPCPGGVQRAGPGQGWGWGVGG